MSSEYNRKDSFYQKAKEEGYRSRASYKLLELDKAHSLLRPGMKVLDLGAWPGGWMQVAAKRVGPSGLVVGIDLVQLEAFDEPQVKVIRGDVRDDEMLAQICALAPQGYDLIMSDMSPKLTGIREADTWAAIGLAELAVWAAQKALRSGGNLLIKVFKSNESAELVRKLRSGGFENLVFEKVVAKELESTRKSSNEYYLVGLSLKAQQAA
jgi:23S rRNA (uridine2552-2'-O)-methyltransferase